MNELSRRAREPIESVSIGYGGIAIVSRATGFLEPAIRKGINKIKESGYQTEKIRRSGGRRKYLTVKNPDMIWKLKDLF